MAPLLALISLGAPALGSDVLLPGTAVDREIGPGETHRYTIALQAGEFLRAALLQEGAEVSVHLSGPDATDAAIDVAEFGHGREPASLLAGRTGTYVCEVRSAQDVPSRGRYTLVTDSPRTATPEDRDRLGTERALAEGIRLLDWPRALALEKARPPLEQALAGSRRLADTELEARATTWLALATTRLPDLAKAAELHERALGLWTELGDRHDLALGLVYAAEVHVLANQLPLAVDRYERGLALSRSLGVRQLEIVALTNLATVYSRSGDTLRAIRASEEALPVLRALGLRSGEAAALGTIARSRMRRSEHALAIDVALQALAIHREIANGRGQALMLDLLADVYVALGDPAAGLVYLEQALPLWREHGLLYEAALKTREAATIDRIAAVHGMLDDLPRALEHHQRALALRRELGDGWGEARSQLSLAQVHLRERRWRQAVAACREALPHLREAGDRYELARALELLGSAESEGGESAAAQAALAEALALWREVGDRAGEASTLHALARVDLGMRALASARGRLEEALRLVETERIVVGGPERRAFWLATVRGISETYIGVLMDLHAEDPGLALDTLAFQASEASHARSLLELLSAPAVDDAEAAPELLEREGALRERLAARLDEQVRLLARPHTHEERARLAREVQELTNEYDQARARLHATNPRRAALERPATLSLNEIQGRVLDRDTLLLEYALGAEKSYVWAVEQRSFRAQALPGRAVIEAAARKAHARLGSRPTPGSTSDTHRALAELAEIVLVPLGREVEGKRLIVVADGALHYVPFSALPDRGGEPLIKTREVVNVPSIAVLDVLREQTLGRQRPAKTLAVLADPVFDAEDERLLDRKHRSRTKLDPTLQRAVRDHGYAGDRLSRLPFTRREAQRILALVPPASRRQALDFEANRATALDPELGTYRFLHFATHGLLNGSRPDLSGVVLSLLDKDGRDVRGFLAAPDVFKLRLGADLVVLSGCTTALGREVGGEGLVGLTRAFLSAGARGVVASLWRVDDLPTAELMVHLYRGMLGPEQLGPAAALRAAQLSLLRSGSWREPYYWAGFQFQGSWWLPSQR